MIKRKPIRKFIRRKPRPLDKYIEYCNENITLLHGDCRDILKFLPDKSINCCVTSPPYYGLRDYGTSKWEGGNDPACEHKGRQQTRGESLQGGDTAAMRDKPFNMCPQCGAIRIDSQIGLESTPEEYISKLVDVFREIRRVLKDDGVLWLNLGDSYARIDGQANSQTMNGKTDVHREAIRNKKRSELPNGIKSKDLIGIPWMVAFALRADGWYLRQDIIWHKPNPMPESVTDRCTKAHEYIFLLAKSQKYYFDSNAIKEPCLETSIKRAKAGFTTSDRDGDVESVSIGANKRTRYGLREKFIGKETRNRRSVWTVTTKPFKDAHFATFPPDLIEPCVLAGCPENGIIIDPFNGAGTTGLVALKNKRKYIGCELNKEYVNMTWKRLCSSK